MTANDQMICFNRSGCLTSYAIRCYIRGNINSDQKERIEIHLQQCELCMEALRGYKSHRKSVTMRKDLNYLSRRIRKRYLDYGHNPNRKIYIFLGLTIAAILVLLALLYFIYRYFQIIQ